jgi:hypothetical protein
MIQIGELGQVAFYDNTGEFLAAALRRGNAGSNTAADHIAVLDAALAQLPDAHRHGTPVLVRADTAGCTREFLAHIRGLRDTAVSCEFSVGWHRAHARAEDRIRCAKDTGSCTSRRSCPPWVFSCSPSR